VQRLYERHPFGSLLEREVRVQNLGAVWDELLEIDARVFEEPGRDLDDLRGLRDFGSGLREQRHAVTESREPANQRDDDALRSTVASTGSR